MLIDSQAFSHCFPMRFASAGFQGKTRVKLAFSKIGIRHLKPACFTGCRALFRTENKGLEARFEPSGGSSPHAAPRGRPPRHRMAPHRPSDSLFQLISGIHILFKNTQFGLQIALRPNTIFWNAKSAFNIWRTQKSTCCQIMLNPPVATPANRSLFIFFYKKNM